MKRHCCLFLDGSFEWTEVKHVYLDSECIITKSEVPPTSKNQSKLFPVLDKCGMLAVIDQIKLPHPKYPATRVVIQVPNLGFHFSPSKYSRIMNLLAIFNERDVIKDGLDETNSRMGHTSWHPADMEGDARVLFWGRIGNSVAEWQSCWLALAGSYLYALESKTSQTYQRCCSMSAKQIMEIPPASVGGSDFIASISNRGIDIQKALESSSAVVLQFKDEHSKAELMKAFVHAIYKASAPLSMSIPGNLSGAESKDESCQPVVVSEKTNLSVVDTLLEMKLLIYGKEDEEKDRTGEERMLLALFAGGGKVNLIQQENDLTVRMTLHSLRIEDKLQGHMSTTCKYIACSVLENDSQGPAEEIINKCSTALAENISEESFHVSNEDAYSSSDASDTEDSGQNLSIIKIKRFSSASNETFASIFRRSPFTRELNS